jgi:predicted RNase H-like HicB family nuclease
MKSSLNILIEKDDFGYVASCSQIEGYKVTAKSLDVVVNNLKITIQDYLEKNNLETENNSNQPIWEIAQNLIEDLTEEEKAQLPKDGAVQHDHYIYGTPKIS